jgi:hypothetical protein
VIRRNRMRPGWRWLSSGELAEAHALTVADR